MKYPPNIHQENDKSHLIKVIKRYPLATLISIEDEVPLITHLPLIYEAGKLIGHIDKNNPQAALLTNDKPVIVIFSGPDCYISPSLFHGDQLPTWNYIKVHVKGKAKAITDADLVKKTMVAMTQFLEHPNHSYVLKIDNPKMEQFVNYVVGFEIEITHWEGKFKLSQNKSQEEQAQAKAALIKSSQQDITDIINELTS